MKCFAVIHETPAGIARHWESSRSKANAWLAGHQMVNGKNPIDQVVEIQFPEKKKDLLDWLNLYVCRGG